MMAERIMVLLQDHVCIVPSHCTQFDEAGAFHDCSLGVLEVRVSSLALSDQESTSHSARRISAQVLNSIKIRKLTNVG
jgi:hypothetical protein